MKSLAVVLLIVLLPGFATAAQIVGSLKEGDRPIGQGVPVQIQYGNTPVGKGTTDNYGSYNLFVKQKGNCTFSVYYGGAWVSTTVYSYDTAVRYDFDLVRQSDGRYVLRRR